MKQEIAKKWAAALRSGEYRQGSRALCSESRTGGRAYCCLGVLCELAAEEGVVEAANTHFAHVKRDVSLLRYGHDGGWRILPPEVMEWAEMKSRDGEFLMQSGQKSTLTVMNDLGAPFRDIAQTIDRHQEEL